MIAGYQNSTDHDAVVMIDGDLQHPPEYIPQMVEGYLRDMIKFAKETVKVKTSLANLCLVFIIK